MTVEIAGVGLHPFGRHPGVSLTDMGATAVARALDEAGARTRGAFQAAFCGTAYGGVATGHRILGRLALTGGPIIDVEAGCASGAAALQLAAEAVEAGRYESVLVFGVEKMPKGVIRSSFFEPWHEQAGLTPAPAYFALRAQRLLREAGLDKSHLADVVVKNRRHGVANPDAMYRSEVTTEDVLASRLVCDPLHLWMLCSPNEGAAAILLRRRTEGERRSGTRPVRLAAVALRSHLPGDVLNESSPFSGLVDPDVPTPTQLAARAAYEASGLGPGDVHVAEVQDTDAARELMAWQELGFCERGEQAGLLSSGDMGLGGRLPVNPSGGLLSKGEPLGASALGQVVELTQQLRGTAGARQAEGARVALAHTVGRGANASVTLLTA